MILNHHHHHHHHNWLPPHSVIVLCPLLLLLQLMLQPHYTSQAKPPVNTQPENRMILQDRAILHLNLMNTLGRCRVPRLQVIYPPTSGPHKRYYPRGTLLHRCSDVVGCCANAGEVCRPESVTTVEKVFFVNHMAIGQRTAGGGHRTSLRAPRNFTTATEVVSFTNHTACKCIRLAPDAIEHDELQSVVSRPVASRSIAVLSATHSSGSSALLNTTVLYHVIGGLASVILLVICFLLYRWLYPHRLLRREP